MDSGSRSSSEHGRLSTKEARTHWHQATPAWCGLWERTAQWDCGSLGERGDGRTLHCIKRQSPDDLLEVMGVGRGRSTGTGCDNLDRGWTDRWCSGQEEASTQTQDLQRGVDFSGPPHPYSHSTIGEDVASS